MLWAPIPFVIAVMAGGQAAPLPVLTDIKAIRALSQAEAARGYPVHIRGVITHFDESPSNPLFLFVGTAGQFIEAAKDGSLVARGPIRNGDTIEVLGHAARRFAPNVVPSEIRDLGAIAARRRCTCHARVAGDGPPRLRATWKCPGDPPRLAVGGTRIRNVHRHGARDGVVIRAAFWDHHTGDLERFIDARVRVRGNVGAIFGPTGQLVGVSLLVGRTSDVDVLESPIAPFALPIQPIGHIFTYSYAAEANRRIRIRGVVVGEVPARAVDVSDYTSGSVFRSVRHSIYVKDQTGSVSVESEQTSPINPGDVIDVAGFPAVSPGKPVLGDAVFRVVGSEPIPTPTQMPAGAVVRADNEASGRFTILDIVAGNALGLLFRISRVISQHGCDVDLVLISTEGERAIDVFHLTKAGVKITEAEQRALTSGLQGTCEGTR